MKRKPTPAQIAARERFAEMARSGAFKRKRNPAKKTVSQKISQLTREGYPQKQAVAIALSEEKAGKVKRNPISGQEAGEFRMTVNGKTVTRFFAYDNDAWANSHGFNYRLLSNVVKVGSPVRFTKTRAIVAIDEAADGSPVTETWEIRNLKFYKTNPRAANPIILVSDKPKRVTRKSNPAKPKRQRMLNISWLTAGGQREIMSVPIEFVFTHYVGNVAERFFVRTENGQLIVSEYSTGGRIGQVPYTMRAAALNDREAAKRYVAEMLSKIGAERFKTAVKKFDPIN